MGTATYRIVPQPNLTFSVEIFGPGEKHYGAHGFTSAAYAEAWINEKKRAAKADQKWERVASNISPVASHLKI